jgi:hypothetical protein
MLFRIGRVEEDFVDQLFNSSEKRLARTLLLLASFGEPSKAEPATLKVSQGTLADMIGTTRSEDKFFHESVQEDGPDRLQRHLAGAPRTADVPSPGIKPTWQRQSSFPLTQGDKLDTSFLPP